METERTFRPARGGGHEARGPVATGKGPKVGTESPLRGEQSRLHFCAGDVFVPPRKRRDRAAGGGGYKRRGRASWGKHLCAWGNDAAHEVIPRRVNCWLKTISKPPHWPTKPLRISGRAPPLRRRESPTNQLLISFYHIIYINIYVYIIYYICVCLFIYLLTIK